MVSVVVPAIVGARLRRTIITYLRPLVLTILPTDHLFLLRRLVLTILLTDHPFLLRRLVLPTDHPSTVVHRPVVPHAVLATW